MSTLIDTVALSLTPFSLAPGHRRAPSAGEPPRRCAIARRAAPDPPSPDRTLARCAAAPCGARARRTSWHRAAGAGRDRDYPVCSSPRSTIRRRSSGCADDVESLACGRRWRSSDRAPGTPYALAVAERLAGDLAARGVVIVSGLARGVDSAAHRGALAAGGRTVAVLGCGRRRHLSARARAPCRSIWSQTGALVSELVPGTPSAAAVLPAGATASSAACRGRWWWLKRARRAAR